MSTTPAGVALPPGMACPPVRPLSSKARWFTIAEPIRSRGMEPGKQSQNEKEAMRKMQVWVEHDHNKRQERE